MTIVQPRASTVVQPRSDFQFLDNGRRLVYHAESQAKGRKVLVQALSIPFGIFMALGMFAAGILFFFNDGSISNWILAAVLLTMAAWSVGMLLLSRWSEKPLLRSIEFDDKAISFGGKTYLLEHVSSIGWRAQSGYVGGGFGLQGVAMLAASKLRYEASGEITMQYGADEIAIINNLHPDNTRNVYDKIVGFLGQFGHKYSQ